MNRAIALAALAGAVFVGSPQAKAWECLTGSCPKWCSAVPYGLTRGSDDLDASTNLSEVRRGMDDWTLRSCTSLTTTFNPSATGTAGAGDGRSVIGWVEGGWRHGSSAIGVTGPRWNGRNCIIEADMEMNGQNFTWITGPGSGSRVNTYSITLHEGGHYYGLGHSNDRNATMYFAYTGGIDAINADDEGGICTLYPGDGPVDCTVSGCPAGQECVGGSCQPVMGDGTVCAPCTGDSDCGGPNDYCIRYPDGNTFCGRACSGASDCTGDGEVCAGTTGGVSQCARMSGGTFSCAGAMVDPGCRNDSDCDPDERCNTGTGDCEPRPMGGLDLGAPCTDSAECNSGLCGTTSLGSICTQGCDGFDVGSCPGGFYCDGEAVGVCGMGLCLPGAAGAAPLGGACSVDTECASLNCTAGSCTNACRPDSGVDTCPDGFSCQSGGAAGCGACRADAELGAIGDACGPEMECASGLCAAREDETFCTEVCSDDVDCPEGFTCASVGEGGLCAPPIGRLDSGCGCRVVGLAPSEGPDGLVILLVLPALVLWRRRRRRG